MESTRRGMMAAAGAAAAIAAVTPKAFAAWEASERYPDPSVQVLDPAFNKYRLLLASVERLYTGARWSEGPVWMGDWRCLLWSDIPNNRILRWDEETGRTSVYRKPSNNANGNTRDRQGRLVTCEHDARRVTRTEPDGTITVLIDKFDKQAAQLAERHRGQVRRLDLVLRSPVRHPRQLRGPCGNARAADQRLPARSADKKGDGRRRRRLPPQRACPPP